jgi:hypothetical protein
MLKNLFLNTSAIRYSPDAEGNKTAAELERESIQVEELKPRAKEEDTENEGNETTEDTEQTETETTEEVDATAGATETEEVEETAEQKVIREAEEAANASVKTKRQVERMQKRIDALTAKSRTTETENLELKKLLDAKKKDGTLTLTEDEVDRRAELKAEGKVAQLAFDKAVKFLAEGANKLDKEFQKNIKAVTDEAGLLPPVMIGILEDLEDESGKSIGAEVLVHLSKDLDAYEDILGLSEGRMALKLKAIADKITKKTPKRISTTPAPNTPIGGSRVAAAPLNDKMTTEEWIAKREAEVAARVRR